MQVLFVKNKIIADKKEKYIKSSIHSPTGRIAVGCPVKKPSEKGVKKIKCIFDPGLQRKNG